MNQLQVIKHNGANTVDSRQVAEMIERPHNDLMKTIRQYIEYLGEGDFSQSDSYMDGGKRKITQSDFFIESTYQNQQNKTQPCYLLTKKGCDMVANKLTGAKGVQFTAAYVTKFEEMEKQIANPYLGLSPELQAIIAHDHKIQRLESKFEELPLLGVDCEELQKRVKKVAVNALGGFKSPAYNNKSISQKVFRDIQAQIKREHGVVTYKGIKRNQLDQALAIVDSYKLPTVLKIEINAINNQQQLDL